MSDPERQPVVYRYEDEHGQVHIVDALEKVPARFREAVEEVDLAPARADVTARKSAPPAVRTGEFSANQGVVAFLGGLDPPSVGVGVALGLVLVFVGSLVRGSFGWLVKAGLLAAVVVLLAGAYLGWLHRTAGMGEGVLSTPSEMVEGARKAGLQLERRLQRQQEMLDHLERSP